jgi:hypothetical protein
MPFFERENILPHYSQWEAPSRHSQPDLRNGPLRDIETRAAGRILG